MLFSSGVPSPGKGADRKMIKFILKRLVMMIPVLLGVTLVVFTIMYFTPGDPAFCRHHASDDLNSTAEN